MICLVLFMQEMPVAFALAFESAGRSIPARIAMIAMTTSSSMSVKPVGADARCEIVVPGREILARGRSVLVAIREKVVLLFLLSSLSLSDKRKAQLIGNSFYHTVHCREPSPAS